MKKKVPASASSFKINLFGGICYIVFVKLALFFYPTIDFFILSVMALLVALVPIVLCEIIILKTYKRPHLGFVRKTTPDKERIALKLLGYYGSIAFVMLLYCITPEYSHEFYESSFLYLEFTLLIFIIVGWLYISEIDRYMSEPYDAYWHLGNLLFGRWKNVDTQILFAHLKSVLLRAYFIPVMFSYFAINTDLLLAGNDEFIKTYLSDMPTDVPGMALLKFFILVYFYLAVMDVMFAVIGYVMPLRVFDSHIRSTEPTFLGWFVCLICYFPFWETLMIPLLFQQLYSNPEWYVWLKGMPAIIPIWGVFVIFGMCMESISTLTFGIRFSNLTYRGLITEGPFRLTKHPQYIFKMINRFCFYLPFLSLFGFWGACQTLLMFAGICFIYYLRAKTEENHLSRYPEYVEYANWIDENGLFCKLNKFFPALKYSETKAKEGRLW